MPVYTLTDDQAHWVAVAIEQSKSSAEGWSIDPDDTDTLLDQGLLIWKYNDLQRIFPPPEVGLKDTDG